MQQKINAIFTKRDLELNGSLRFNDDLSLCNRALGCKHGKRDFVMRYLRRCFAQPVERADPLMSRLFEPEKVVAFTSFSAKFTFFSIKTATKFHQNTENENFCRKRHLS